MFDDYAKLLDEGGDYVGLEPAVALIVFRRRLILAPFGFGESIIMYSCEVYRLSNRRCRDATRTDDSCTFGGQLAELAAEFFCPSANTDRPNSSQKREKVQHP